MKFFTYIPYALIGSALLCTCVKSPTAGGSSDSGNVKLAGIIHTNSGSRAIGATVTICPANYTASTGNDSAGEERTSLKRTITDHTGHFQFDSIKAGDYCIEGNDGISSAVLLKVNVVDSTDTSLFHEDTLHPYAVVEGNIGRSPAPSIQRYVLVYGLDRRIPADAEGDFIVDDMPVGTFRFRITSSDTSFDPISFDAVTLVSGDTLSVPCFGWRHHARIFLNTTSSGADITGDVVGFPALLRLTKDNFTFGEAAAGGLDCRFTKSDDTPLPFEIERWDEEREFAEIWVKIDTVFGNDDSRYFNMFWGNPGTVPLTMASGAVFDTSDGFQVVWHLSDTHVDSVNDATWNHYNGTASGMTATSVTEGIVGKARLFDGVSSFISLENSSNGKLNFPQDGFYSLSAWVFAEALDHGSHVVISKGDEQYFLCSVEGSSKEYSWSFTEFKDQVGWLSTASPATEGVWVLLTGVKNGTSQYLYVNGEAVDSGTTLTPSQKSRITTFDIAIGKFMETGVKEGDGFFNGSIDEVRISSIPLSADWIRLCRMNQQAEDRLLAFRDKE
ncbi:MAG: DUF2341 domain-containing protein [Chitinispirillaceae bacterium]|nr:DUF2341 domain-containing protein [Chitinispirillaceae bacterium]